MSATGRWIGRQEAKPLRQKQCSRLSKYIAAKNTYDANKAEIEKLEPINNMQIVPKILKGM